MAKKFVNRIDQVVDDSLKGLVLSNTGITFDKECHRVVVQCDFEFSSKPKVSLIAGGGSGHEPYAAGYVGKGLLTAAVAGNIFASPPSNHVLSALNATKSDAGSILFIINYTGDRLNFGLAASKFDGNVKVITIADDVAIDNPNNRVGRRGLAGAVLALKIAGAMSEQGKTSEEIYTFVTNVFKKLVTLGVSLYPCALPGKDREATLHKDEIEIGLGIHGEPGRTKTTYTTVHDIIQNVLTTLKSKYDMKKKETFVVMINNLGSVSQVEMNIINGEVVSWFNSQDMKIERLFSGTYMTSLDGHGISITLLRLDGNDIVQIINRLDEPSEAPGWIPSISVNQFQTLRTPKNENISNEGVIKNVPISGGLTDPLITHKCLLTICETARISTDLLNRLDAIAGDGDCGSTFANAAKYIESSMENLSKDHLQTLLQQLSIIFEQTVGGTSGALYALMLSSAASSFAQNTSAEICENALAKANEAVQLYGGARPGDRTMVDSLNAAVESLKSDKSADRWENAVKASELAAESTRRQHAAVGRASYTSAEAQIEPDAGATAISIWLRTIWETVKNHQENE